MSKVCKVERRGEGNGDTGSAGDKKSVSAKNNEKVSISIHFKVLGGFNDIRLKTKKKSLKKASLTVPLRHKATKTAAGSWSQTNPGGKLNLRQKIQTRAGTMVLLTEVSSEHITHVAQVP